MELKLSDAFETKNGEPELELKVQVYNINRGKKCAGIRNGNDRTRRMNAGRRN